MMLQIPVRVADDEGQAMMWLVLAVGIACVLAIQLVIGMGMRELREHYAERDARAILEGAFAPLDIPAASFAEMADLILAGNVTAEKLDRQLQKTAKEVVARHLGVGGS